MSKILIPLFLLLAVVCNAVKIEEGFGCMDQLSDRQAKAAFDEFEGYLERHKYENDLRVLEFAKKFSSSWLRGATLSRKAASLYVYLNEFDQCEPKAIRCMYDAQRGREYAKPKSAAFKLGGEVRFKTRLENLLESSLVRASIKCRSFVEPWFWKTEEKLDVNSRSLLYELMPHHHVTGRLAYVAHRFVNDTLKKENLLKQVSVMDDTQLVGFFRDRITEKFVKPCEKYFAVMSPLFDLIEGFGFGYNPMSKLFFDPISQDMEDHVRRLDICRRTKPFVVDVYAKEAARIYKTQAGVLNVAEEV